MTELIYLGDSYLSKLQATVVQTGADDKGNFLILDRTIFYPQGGGQPSDEGGIVSGDTRLAVKQAQYIDATVRHYISGSVSGVAPGTVVATEVDMDRRLRNARLHTGGHLLSHVIEVMFDGLKPIKGYHFPEGPHVEFTGSAGISIGEQVSAVNERLVSEIAKSALVTARLANADEIFKLRPHLAAFVPKDKPTRIVTVGGFLALPCGGTHVADLGQLGQVRVTKIKAKKENIKVSYELAAPAL